jgi:carboxyl-terminal processing protease
MILVKKVLKIVLVVFLVFCVLFTATGVGLIATNYNNLGNFIESYFLIENFFLWPPETDALIEGMIDGMVLGLDDKYSRYFSPEEFKSFKESFQGIYGGIGIYADFVDDMVVVVSTMKDSPGEKAGLLEGDAIIGVNGESVAGKSINEIVALIKGEPDTEVTLTVKRNENEVFDVSIIRKYIDNPTVYTEMLTESPEFGYVQIAGFSQKTYPEFLEEMNELLAQGPKGLIIDLRGNPGGELEAIVNVTGSFIPEGPVIHQVDNKGEIKSIVTSGNTLDMPIVVLTNGGTASAAEAMTGALQDNGVAYVIGTKTFGKGIVQTIFPLGNGGGLELTTHKYLTAGKRDIHEVGITPDLVVELTSEDTYDKQLEAAIDYLKEKTK